MAKKTVHENFELNLYDAPDVSKMTGLTPHEVDVYLYKLPPTIKAYGIQYAKKLEEVEHAKNNLKRVTAKKHLEAVAKKDIEGLGSDADRKAWANNSEEVIQAELRLISARTEAEIARIMYEYAENLFVAVRKTATIMERGVRADDDYVKYGKTPDWASQPRENVHQVTPKNDTAG